MKYLKLFENFNSENLSEAVKSDILRTIINSDLIKKQKLDRFGYWASIDWANLTDNDFKQVSPKEARSKQYENNLLFWFNDSKLVGISYGKDVQLSAYGERFGKRWSGRIKEPSSKALAENTDLVYVLVSTKSEDRFSLIKDRTAAKTDALALTNPNQIADANRERYRSIITNKKSKDDNIDILVAYFMDKYSTELSKLSITDKKRYSDEPGSLGMVKKQVSIINKKLHNLLNSYDQYIYILEAAKGGEMYAHQEPELKGIKDMFKKWEDADEVDPFSGEMTSSSALKSLYNRRRR